MRRGIEWRHCAAQVYIAMYGRWTLAPFRVQAFDTHHKNSCLPMTSSGGRIRMHRKRHACHIGRGGGSVWLLTRRACSIPALSRLTPGLSEDSGSYNLYHPGARVLRSVPLPGAACSIVLITPCHDMRCLLNQTPRYQQAPCTSAATARAPLDNAHSADEALWLCSMTCTIDPTLIQTPNN